MQIILDYSANNHKNDLTLIKRAIDEIKQYDTGKHDIIFKSQLFNDLPPNIACTYGAFDYMYEYCKTVGYKCTASVFDKESLDFLLTYDIPFVKIACNEKYYPLIGEIPRKYNVIVSIDNKLEVEDVTAFQGQAWVMACTPEYPADIKTYKLRSQIYSDHTIGLELVKKYEPLVWEKHLKLEDSDGPDAGEFAITPKELKEIL